MPKETTIKLTSAEVEAMQNIFRCLKAEHSDSEGIDFDEDHIPIDIVTLDAILRRADTEVTELEKD